MAACQQENAERPENSVKWRKHQAQQWVGVLDSDRPLSAPVSGPPQQITLYIAYDGDGVMRQRSARVALPDEASARAREVLRALLAEEGGLLISGDTGNWNSL